MKSNGQELNSGSLEINEILDGVATTVLVSHAKFDFLMVAKLQTALDFQSSENNSFRNLPGTSSVVPQNSKYE